MWLTLTEIIYFKNKLTLLIMSEASCVLSLGLRHVRRLCIQRYTVDNALIQHVHTLFVITIFTFSNSLCIFCDRFAVLYQSVQV